MMTIRADQVAILDRAQRRRRQRELVGEAAATPAEADEILEQARADAAALGLGDAAFERYLELSLGLGEEELSTRWGWMLGQVLANDALDADRRMAFIDKHLVPRLREEDG